MNRVLFNELVRRCIHTFLYTYTYHIYMYIHIHRVLYTYSTMSKWRMRSKITPNAIQAVWNYVQMYIQPVYTYLYTGIHELQCYSSSFSVVCVYTCTYFYIHMCIVLYTAYCIWGAIRSHFPFFVHTCVHISIYICTQFYTQPLAFGVTLNLIPHFHSNWSLSNGTWQKCRRELHIRFTFDIGEMTFQMQQAVHTFIDVFSIYIHKSMCSYVFFCMYLFLYTYTHSFIHVNICTLFQIYTNIHVYTHIQTNTFPHTFVRV